VSERTPIATYRLQLTPDFGFDAAADIAELVGRLGISHLYLSPIFEARPGSTHGYDQTDPTQIREELGGEAGFEKLVHTAHAAGLGIVLDIVPNHMAAAHDNPWWFGLLRHGPGSEEDRFFDVDWSSAENKVVLPVLGAPFDEVVARGEITMESTCGRGRCIRYFDHVFPLREDVEDNCTAESAATDPDALARLLGCQHYRLVFWRDGLQSVNYRRFFDISDLAGVRAEDELVFERMHAKVFELVRRGWLDGVRLDHIDGLRDPLQYLRRLRTGLDDAAIDGARSIILVEKILASDESLPMDWPVDGTSGYEFLAASVALMMNDHGIRALRGHAARRGSGAEDFARLAIDCKREVAEKLLAPELARLCRAAERCMSLAAVPYERDALRASLIDLSSCLGVYRTFVDDTGVGQGDSSRLREAASRAQQHSGPLADLLSLSGLFGHDPIRTVALDVVRLWQQFTGPLAAKGIEDTALYRDVACLALNDVGPEPVVNNTHVMLDQLAAQRCVRPWSLNATDTHDAKRSEDVRSRLAVLSHCPDTWNTLLDACFERLCASAAAGSETALAPVDVSLLAHSAFALWPDHDCDTREADALAQRLQAYAIKAAREAKRSTSWLNPDPAYEDACARAVHSLLFADSCAGIRAQFAELTRATRPSAGRCSIAAVLLKTLFPGTPDWYQGTECRALSLVDPDNRRPVPFARHRELLTQIEDAWRADPLSAASELLHEPDSDRAKLFVTWRALALRRQLLAGDGAIMLVSRSMTASQWRWAVRAGGHRCAVTVTVRALSDDPRPAPPQAEMAGVDQLSGRGTDEASSWASVVVEDVWSLW